MGRENKNAVRRHHLDLIRGPIKVITFVSLLRIGMQAYTWPEALRAFFPKAFTVVIAGTLTYVLFRCVDVFVRLWQSGR